MVHDGCLGKHGPVSKAAATERRESYSWSQERKSVIESLEQQKKLKMEEPKAATAEIEKRIAKLKSKKWLMKRVAVFRVAYESE